MKNKKNYYLVAGLFMIVVLTVISVISIFKVGLDSSGFILGILASAIGSAVAFLFNMSRDVNLERIKKYNFYKSVKIEVTSNYDLILEWEKEVKKHNWTSITFADSIKQLLSVDKIKQLDMVEFTDIQKKEIYAYLKMIIDIKSGKALKPKDFELTMSLVKEVKKYIEEKVV